MTRRTRHARIATTVDRVRAVLSSRPVALWTAGVVAVVLALVLPLVSSAARVKQDAHPDAKNRPGRLVAIPHFRDVRHVHGSAIRAADSGTPSPPFRECPAIGADQSCGVLIYVTGSGATVLSDPSQGPYDGGDDTLVGVVNASSKTISGLSLSSSTDIFGFDGDGICTYSGWAAQSGCPYGPTGYEGPGTQLDGNGGDAGSVIFTNTLKPGGVAYFGLEDALTKANLANPRGYVALGDSYASGQGSQSGSSKSWYSKACLRGPGAWPILLGKDSGGSLVIKGSGKQNSFFACSGATSGQILSGQVPELENYKQEYGSPGLVTLTAGGDDVHFAWVLGACYSGGFFNIHQCTAAITAEIVYLTRWHKSFSNKLAALYSKVARAAGTGSRIEVVGYPKIVPPWTSVLSAAWNCSWIAAEPDALVLANEMADDLNGDIRQAASQAHVGYAPVDDAVAGHTMCTGDPWIAEISPYNIYTEIAGHPTPPAQSNLASTVLNDMRDAGLPFVVKRGRRTTPSRARQVAAATAMNLRPFAQEPGPEEPLTADGSAVPGEATVGYPYVGYLTVAGGTEPYSWSVTGGSLPAGLSLDSESGVISGQPTATGSSTFTVTASDSTEPTPATSSLSVTISVSSPAALNVTTKSPPTATAGRTYETMLHSSGGTSPITWSVQAGSLPPGLSLDGETGVISGTPTSPGTSPVTLRATDSTEPTTQTATAELQIAIVGENEPLTLATTELGATSQGAYYSETLASTGGTGPVEWSVSSGALPAGLSLDASSGTISGIATEAGTFLLTVTASDRATPVPHTVNARLSVTVAPGSKPTILTNALSGGEQGVGYYETLSATGGVGTYTWYVSEGLLPPGVTLNSSSGTIEGTPTESGTFAFTATASDGATPTPQTASQAYSLKIAASPPSIEFAPPPATVGVPYEYTPSVSGGVPPYTWALSSGELPSGLTLDSSTGTIEGTPTATGSRTVGISLSDSSQPTSQSIEANASIAVEPAPSLQILSRELPPAVDGQPYRALMVASGGTNPLSWSITSGALPPGLSLDPETGVVSGTPSGEGTAEVTIQVTDSSLPTHQTQTATIALVVEAPPELVLATESLSEATAGSSYSASLFATGGTTPYSWSIASGSLPPGLSLSVSGQITGTPTAPGEYSFVVNASDSTSPSPKTATATLSLTVAAASPLTITSKSVSNATQGVYYSEALDTYGGVPPDTWSLTGGSLPAGLTLDAFSGQIYGEAKSFGNYSFTVKVSDSSTPEPESASASYAIDVAPAPPLTLGAPSLAGGTQGQYYDQSLDISGGVGPFSISVVSGTLPTGLYVDEDGEIYGEITSAQSPRFTLRIEDQSSPTPQVVTREYTIQVTPAAPLELTSTIGKFVVGQYGYGLLDVTGGVPAYTYTVIVNKLPPGLYFNSGEIYGTATKTGKGSIEVNVTDSATPTAGSVTKTIGVSVVKPGKLKFATKKLPQATQGTYYDQLIQLSGGSPGYTWTITAGSLPPGMYFNYGELYGTPSEAGTYALTLKATDSGQPTPQTATKKFKLKVLKQ
jgi:hypothetical protein